MIDTKRIIAALSLAISISLTPILTYAAQDCDTSEFGCFEISIPNSDINTETTIDSLVTPGSTPFVTYAIFIANTLVALTGAMAIVMVVVGGYVYMSAGGSGERINLSKSIIGSALLGLALSLTAYVILNTISPQFASNIKDPTELVPP